ncbi:hypothetical protein BDB00DRAFT_866397 [Zychaea mexicana]|uniref:uncharacterized protein n=1 Tax=Zychaea mexicana TaxID=64656 RepID=UPI0022FEC3B0|nr:uncharacterized protein BDB00DRAFT_866397 [Zychaea mexicana]KAI9499524.1 hypothetical protein BDB00DRAFT_866397 [Zychaea mexicana]
MRQIQKTQSRANHVKGTTLNQQQPQQQQQQQRSQHGNVNTNLTKSFDESYDEQIAEQQREQKQTEKPTTQKQQLSIVHYVLAMPLAAVYIVARALLDCIRGSVFWTLWFIEKSAPMIDAWLFDKVTVWLPAKYAQCEQWWTTRGVHVCYETQQYALYTAIPATIHCIDHLFIGIVHFYRWTHKISIQFGDAWQRFAKQHDWKQLASDMANVWTAVVWKPTVWTVYRFYRLGVLLYYGSQQVLRSIKNDLTWLATIALPTIWSFIKATRMYDWVSRSASWTSMQMKWVVARALEQVALPLLRNARCGIITTVDFIASVIESHGFQTRLQKMRTVFFSNVVWLIEEQAGFFTNNVELLMPCIAYFTNEIMPSLAKAYKRLTTMLWAFYIRQIRPALISAYFFVQPTIIAYYRFVSDTVSDPIIAVWMFAQSVSSRIWVAVQLHGHHTLAASIRSIQQSANHTWLLSKQLYVYLTLWIEKHAPYILDVFSKAWELAVSNGWALVQLDTTEMKDWVVKVSAMTFESLERTLSEWIKEQSQTSYTATNKEKAN